MSIDVSVRVLSDFAKKTYKKHVFHRGVSVLAEKSCCKVIVDGLKGVEKDVAEKEMVLVGPRRNGMLSYRPDVDGKKLVEVDGEKENGEWAKDLPFKSHRLQDPWCKERVQWRDEDGVPARPDYGRNKRATSVAEMAEAEYCAEEEGAVTHVGGKDFSQIHVDITDIGAFEAMELTEDCVACAKFQRHPRMRTLQTKVDENVQAVKKKATRKSVRRLSKQTRKLERHAVKGPLAALVAEVFRRKRFSIV